MKRPCNLTTLGVICWWLFIFEVYEADLDEEITYNFWNPLFLLVPPAILILGGTRGVVEAWKNFKLGLATNKHRRRNLSNIKDMSRFNFRRS